MQAVVLGKHKYYCEMCKKQCRDENAFRQHKLSSFHQHRMMEFHQNPEAFIERYSNEFLTTFNETFRIKFGLGNFIPATKAYNEYIKDPHHTHLNSTKWANLTDFVQYLEDNTDLYEVGREQISIGGSEKAHEQLMIKMIDKNDMGGKSAMNDRERREQLRELEKRREEKELEKIIKKANKLQAQQDKKKQQMQQNVQEQIGKQQESVSGSINMEFSNKNYQQSSELQKSIQQSSSSGLVGTKRFNLMSNNDDDAKNELLLLQKSNQKPSVLDKLIKHQTTNQQQRKEQQSIQQDQKTVQNIHAENLTRPLWVRRHLIVKIKDKESKFHNIKAQVLEARDIQRILVRLQNENKQEIYVKESQLTKVLPSEGGRVMILKGGHIGEVKEIDIKYKEMLISYRDDKDGRRREQRVKFDEVCKINS